MTQVHVYSSGEAGIFANAYIVETEESLIAIDTTLTVSEAHAFGQKLKALRKPLAAVLITHAHPDHIAGLSIWLGNREIPIHALSSVDRLLRAIEEPKRAQWSPVFKEEWVSKWTFPNRLVKDGEVIAIDGTELQVYDLGPGGDCDANSVWVLKGKTSAAFVGDLVFNGTHSYLADGHTADWLRNLERTRSLLPASVTLYPGHGGSGGVKLLNAQIAYLNSYRDAVRELSEGRPTLSETAQAELTRRMEASVTGGKLSFMIGLSANAVAAEIAAGK